MYSSKVDIKHKRSCLPDNCVALAHRETREKSVKKKTDKANFQWLQIVIVGKTATAALR